ARMPIHTATLLDVSTHSLVAQPRLSMQGVAMTHWDKGVSMAMIKPSHVMKREFTTFSALSVALALVSPIVALYRLLGAGLDAAGPAFIWGGLILYAGQFVVVLTLGVLASKWSDAGGIYQWSRRLLGHRYGWFASWTYICTLLITLPAVAYAGAVLVP